MIYDLTMYSGEWELLLTRLETLGDIIDKFIILESNYSHSLVVKPLFFKEQNSLFDKFKDKIIYIVRDSLHSNFHYNDYEARINLYNSIPDPKSDDIIHFSDLDEISNPDVLSTILNNLTEPINLQTSYRFFCVDLYGRQSNDAMIMKHGWVKDPIYAYRNSRNENYIKRIPGAGWHFSSVGKPKDIARKWEYFLHSTEIYDKYKNVEHIRKQIKRKAGSWSENAKDNELSLVNHEYPNLPKYLLDNKEKYNYLFWEYYK